MVGSCRGCYRKMVLDWEIVVEVEDRCIVEEGQLGCWDHMEVCGDESKGKKTVDSHLCENH